MFLFHPVRDFLNFSGLILTAELRATLGKSASVHEALIVPMVITFASASSQWLRDGVAELIWDTKHARQPRTAPKTEIIQLA